MTILSAFIAKNVYLDNFVPRRLAMNCQHKIGDQN